MSYRRTPRASSGPHFPQSPAGDDAERLMREAMATAAYGGTPTLEYVAEDRPTVALSLRVDGGLQVEIRGEMVPRAIALHNDPAIALATIHRMLTALAHAQRAIGLDGAPTQAQVKRWGRQVVLRDDDVETRTIAPRGKLATATTRTAEELGL